MAIGGPLAVATGIPTGGGHRGAHGGGRHDVEINVKRNTLRRLAKRKTIRRSSQKRAMKKSSLEVAIGGGIINSAPQFPLYGYSESQGYMGYGDHNVDTGYYGYKGCKGSL